jgi:peptide/nickel transport system substrate-binding protein
VQSSALDELEGQMVNDVPVIPLMFQAGGGEYTSKAYVGWPSPSNPYELDSPAGKPWDEVVILHLSPRS